MFGYCALILHYFGHLIKFVFSTKCAFLLYCFTFTVYYTEMVIRYHFHNITLQVPPGVNMTEIHFLNELKEVKFVWTFYYWFGTMLYLITMLSLIKSCKIVSPVCFVLLIVYDFISFSVNLANLIHATDWKDMYQLKKKLSMTDGSTLALINYTTVVSYFVLVMEITYFAHKYISNSHYSVDRKIPKAVTIVSNNNPNVDPNFVVQQLKLNRNLKEVNVTFVDMRNTIVDDGLYRSIEDLPLRQLPSNGRGAISRSSTPPPPPYNIY